jgi:hypothetical protein
LYSSSSKHAALLAARMQAHVVLVPKARRSSLVRKYIDKHGQTRVAGKLEELRASQAYPPQFGTAMQEVHAQLHAEWAEMVRDSRRKALAAWRQGGRSGLAVRLRGSARWRDADLREVLLLTR